MQLATFLAKRIAFNKQHSFSRFIIKLATAATALSVAAMIITLAFVNGFQYAVSNKIFNFWGHLRVQEYEPDKAMIAEETPWQPNDTTVQILHIFPQVKQVQAFATKSAVIEKNKEIEGVLFKGVDSSYDFNNLKTFLKQGRFPGFDKAGYSKEILISEPIANELQIHLNDSVNVYFINQQEGRASARRLQVCGIFKTGIEEYDKTFAIGDIRLLRQVYNWQHGEIGGYEVFLNDYDQMDTLNAMLYEMLPQAWISRTIKQIYPNIFDWLQIQNVNRNVIFTVMAIVAIINLVTCLLILILERTRMTGVLKALGCRDWVIQKIFLYHAGIIAIRGILIGLFFGLGICILQQQTGFIKMNEAAYYVSEAPVYIIWWQVFAVCAATLLVCFLALLIPTWLVKTIRPVKAIQFR
ncbi:ABC transporter permease [Parafilimonas sp.]|uniref:ABC transporter permease n=1 Tax=Parafilimonas sp. TaxID=1969739 RepID=UPI0039E29D24